MTPHRDYTTNLPMWRQQEQGEREEQWMFLREARLAVALAGGGSIVTGYCVALPVCCRCGYGYSYA